MYVENLKNDFYEFLIGKRIFLMVHYDIDSICTCKILQSLLKYKHILYTLAVVRGLDDLKSSYHENSNDVKYFVLINCGGTIDIVEELEAEDDITFFILDSHRPIDLCNVYSNGQVRLLSSPEDDVLVPEFHDIFREESDESDNENSNDEDSSSKRRRLDEDALTNRREKRLWEEKRRKLLFEYSQFTYYAKASSIYMFDLAWRVNQDDKDLLWLAIVGLTEQMCLGKIESSQYSLEVGNLQSHATRLRNRTNDTDVQTSLRINFEKDLRLNLYRHWSVKSSIKYSMFTAVKMKLWSLKGDKRLHELLADMGFPLVQSNQAFKTMDLQLRREFHGTLERLSEKYGLQDVVYATFTIQYGYRNQYCAMDIVLGASGYSGGIAERKKSDELFNLALDCLSRTKKENEPSLSRRHCFKTVQSALDMKQIISAGPFVYYIIQEGSPDWYMFSHAHILSLLAHFVLRARM
ncbi:hypothetical protein NQ317_017796 [Molorchus minor]|uniref:Uncharacterized protein n=1 Tax=Molorchus minor TaxID=1323400 RepID=A0ABQ9K0L5_9CUCU|nr:hypothetical protein NQ317_017796 [Molorchus minor]